MVNRIEVADIAELGPGKDNQKTEPYRCDQQKERYTVGSPPVHRDLLGIQSYGGATQAAAELGRSDRK